MTINYTIQADVVDITSDKPRVEDVFLVDTNVWYWVTYPNATSYIPSQLYDYPGYLNNAIAVDSKVHHVGLSLAELSHIIEKREWEIYANSVSPISPKEYRHNLPNEHLRVVSEIKSAWAQVTNLAELLTVSIEPATVAAALNRFPAEKVDGYDLFILESMKDNSVVQVITDDGDFSTVPGIEVFTANSNVIRTAKKQGKFKIR